MDLQDFKEPWNDSDLVLIVQDTRLNVHRCMLTLWSPVFDRMLKSDFLEKDAREITLFGKNSQDIITMLKIMYDRRCQVTGMKFE